MIKNSSKFRIPALQFQKYGWYTSAPVGTTAYKEYWDNESSKCLYGWTSDDGDYITGYNYFYLNYSPILQVKERVIKVGNNQTKTIIERTRDFPKFYDTDYEYFLYVEEAEKLGKHCCVLKKRRAGYSYKNSSMLCRNFFLIPGSLSIAVAAEAEFLTKDGILSKAWDLMAWLDANTAWTKKRQKTDTKMHKRASYIVDKDGTKIEGGFLSEIMGVTVKNDVNKIRGKACKLILFEECYAKDTKILTDYGEFKNIQDFKVGDLVKCPDNNIREVAYTTKGLDNMYKVIQKRGISYTVNSKHSLYLYSNYGGKGLNKELVCTPSEFLKQDKYKQDRTYGLKSSLISFDNQLLDKDIDPYWYGLWLGDGDSDRAQICVYKKTDQEIYDYIMDNHTDISTREIYEDFYRILFKDSTIRRFLKDNDLINNKDILDRYLKGTEKVRLELLAGLLDSDGYLTKKTNSAKSYEICQKNTRLALNIMFLARSLGFYVKHTIKNVLKPSGEKTITNRITISGNIGIVPVKVKRKQCFDYIPYNNHLRTAIKIEDAGIGEYYGITLKPINENDYSIKDRQLILEDFTIGLNCGKFPNLKEAWQIARPSVEQGSNVFGTMVAFGTGGGQDTDYEGLKDLFYEPDGYSILGIPNIWSDGSNKQCGFFVPEYANMEGSDEFGNSFMDEDGNSLKQIALTHILKSRKLVLDNTSDKGAIDRFIAEHPITPEEAFLQISGNIFPKKDLMRHLAYIRNTEAVKNYKQIGELYFDQIGVLKWKLSKESKALTRYKLDKGDSRKGAICIWEHPMDNPPYGLYIACIDSYDHDKSGTDSLGSMFIYKRFMGGEFIGNTIVAEYTARPDTADEFYENCRKLLMYYGAKAMYENQNPGISVYFRNKHCEYLLADQPDIISKIIKDSRVNRGKGCHMNNEIKDWAEGRLKDMLNEEISPGVKWLTTILSEPLIEELISYNDKGNFDRVMSILQLVIYKEELHEVHVRKRDDTEKSIRLFDIPLFENMKQFTYF